MEPIRLGVVGCGLFWEKAHRPTLAKLADRITVTAFAARSDASRQKVARTHPDAAFFHDYRDMFASGRIDAVLIVTPIPMNGPVAIAALQAGLDVFVEKPMAGTLADAQAVLEAERASCGTVYVLEQVAYQGVWRMLSEQAASGKLGRLVMYDRVSHSWMDSTVHDHGGYGKTDWRIAGDFLLGGMGDGGIHEIAGLCQILGRPTAVTAWGRKLRNGFGQYDHVLMVFEYPDDVRGIFSHSWAMCEGRNYFHLRGTDGTLLAEDGNMVFEPIDGPAEKTPIPPEITHEVMWPVLIDCVQTGQTPPYTSCDALRDIHILAAVQESIRIGRRVALA